jgi:transposase
MEAAQGSRCSPKGEKDGTARQGVSTQAADAVAPPGLTRSLAVRTVYVWGKELRYPFMQIRRQERKKLQLVKEEPAVQQFPAEDLPMLSNSTISKAMYAGIDYHKETIAITFGDKSGNVLEQPELRNHRALVEPFFEQFKQLECVVESCRGYEWLVEMLQELGHTVHVGDSRSIKLIACSRCKTDKIDSRILMELLAKGFLPTTYIPSAEERKYRELLRHRSSLIRTATRSKLRIHALLAKENVQIRYPFSLKGRKQLEEIELLPHRHRILAQELAVLDFAEERAHEQKQQIGRHARREPDVNRLKTIPGFDMLMAMSFLGEIGDVSRFKDADQVAAYVGLVPRVYSSGNTRRCGRITKTGPKFMRWMLVQAAWSAIKASPNLRFRFCSIGKRRGQKVAIIAIARKLATIAFRILRDKNEYKEEMLDAGLARAAF